VILTAPVIYALIVPVVAYGVGLIAYIREIIGRTEKHWLPINHARRIISAHPNYYDFVDYGDAEAYNER
jgi:hypothetical protein